MIPLRSSTLLIAVSDARDGHIVGRCITCRSVVSIPLAQLPPSYARTTLGHVGMRLRCDLCGARPVGLMLVESEECGEAHFSPAPAQWDPRSATPLGTFLSTRPAKDVTNLSGTTWGGTGPAAPPEAFSNQPRCE